MKRHDRGDEVFKELDEYMKEYPDFLLNFEEECCAIKLKDNIISSKNNAYPHWARLSYVVSRHLYLFGVSWQSCILALQHEPILTRIETVSLFNRGKSLITMVTNENTSIFIH